MIQLNKFRIYWFNIEQQECIKDCENGFVDAKTEIEALKKWYKYVNAYYGPGSFFRNSTYEAIRF